MSKIQSHVVKVIISDFNLKIPVLLDSHFSTTEKALSDQVSPSTLAANYAVKLSFCELSAEIGVPCTSYKDLEIGRHVTGQPNLKYTGADPAVHQLVGKALISISHTKDTAYGLTVVRSPE